MFKAKLFIFEKEYPLLNYELGSYQPADHEGLPNCRVVLEKIHFSYQSVKDDSAFLSAAISGETLVSGYVRVYKRDGFQKLVDYQFANAYVLSFRETFTSTGEKPMTTHITIGAGIIKRDAHTFENHWNPNDPYEEGEETVIENAPELIRYYITDLKGNETEEYEVTDTIILNLETQNAIGESLTVRIPDKEHDFKHNGVLLTNDTLRDYVINSDLEQIELEVVAEGTEETEA